MNSQNSDFVKWAVESFPEGMLAIDDNDTILLVNSAIELWFGYSREELLRTPISKLIPELPELAKVRIQPDFVHDSAVQPVHGIHKDGSQFLLQLTLNPVTRDDQEITLLSLSLVKSWQLHDLQFQAVFEASPSCKFITSPEGEIVYLNKAAELLFKYPRAELIGKQIEVLFPERFQTAHPAQAPFYLPNLDASNFNKHRNLFGIDKAGVEIPIELQLNSINSPAGLYVLTSIIDISARKLAEARTRQSQKMEAIGTLAGGIVHDFNNILLNITGHTELVQFALADDSDLKQDLHQVILAAQRGKQLVDRILTFSRQKSTERVVVDAAHTVKEVLELLRASLPASVTINDFYDPGTPKVLSDETQIHQIVMNLATNAAHAMPEGGVLEISLAPSLSPSDGDTEHQPIAKISDEHGESLYTRLRIKDTGYGIHADDQKRIFEPFFTTKELGEGSGLGLSIVHGIVESHGGFIKLRSMPGQGTTIDVFLPAWSGDTEVQSDTRAVDTMLSKGHILAVDDEKVLSTLLGRHLVRMGFSVSSFSSSLDALSAYKKQPDRFDMLITDNNMPSMSGVDLARNIRKVRSDVPVLFLSGRVTDDVEKILQDMNNIKSLRKPYDHFDLKEVIDSLLNSCQHEQSSKI